MSANPTWIWARWPYPPQEFPWCRAGFIAYLGSWRPTYLASPPLVKYIEDFIVGIEPPTTSFENGYLSTSKFSNFLRYYYMKTAPSCALAYQHHVPLIYCNIQHSNPVGGCYERCSSPCVIVWENMHISYSHLRIGSHIVPSLASHLRSIYTISTIKNMEVGTYHFTHDLES